MSLARGQLQQGLSLIEEMLLFIARLVIKSKHESERLPRRQCQILETTTLCKTEAKTRTLARKKFEIAVARVEGEIVVLSK